MAVRGLIWYMCFRVNGAAQSFKAGLFRPDLGNEVIEGTISVDRSAFRFWSEAVAETIPADEVVVEREGRKGPICFYDPNRPELKIFTSDTAILQSWSQASANQVRLQIRELAHQGDFSRAVRVTLYVVLGCVLLAWAGYWLSGIMVRSLVARVPRQWEQQLGDEQIQKLEAQKVLLNNTNLTARLTALAQPLLRVVSDGNTRFHFYVAKNPLPNAFALPGGQIVINTALLKLTDRPEELLGVLAHELAHVKHHDAARSILSAAGPIVIFGVFLHSRSGLMNVLSAGSGLMVFQSYSREYETEADDAGWNYLVKANIDPRGMIEMFQKLKAFEAKMKLSGAVPKAFRGHPALDKRIARLEAKWKRLPRHSGFLELTNLVPHNFGG